MVRLGGESARIHLTSGEGFGKNGSNPDCKRLALGGQFSAGAAGRIKYPKASGVRFQPTLARVRLADH